MEFGNFMAIEKPIREFTISFPPLLDTVLETSENIIKIRFLESTLLKKEEEKHDNFFTRREEWNEKKKKEFNGEKKPRENRTPPNAWKILRSIGREEKCELCGTTKYLTIHHKDWNAWNVEPENLMYLNYDCHYGRLHAKGMKKPRDTEEANRIIEEIKKSLL